MLSVKLDFQAENQPQAATSAGSTCPNVAMPQLGNIPIENFLL